MSPSEIEGKTVTSSGVDGTNDVSEGPSCRTRDPFGMLESAERRSDKCDPCREAIDRRSEIYFHRVSNISES